MLCWLSFCYFILFQSEYGEKQRTTEEVEEKEDLRVVVDAVVRPGLAGDVGLCPRPPSSVLSIGSNNALPNVI